jgi:hypothetical protein
MPIWSFRLFSMDLTAPMFVSRRVRSFSSFCARSGFDQSAGSSAREFSSASLWTARSQSKMPPQQFERGLDVADCCLDFVLHAVLRARLKIKLPL